MLEPLEGHTFPACQAAHATPRLCLRPEILSLAPDLGEGGSRRFVLCGFLFSLFKSLQTLLSRVRVLRVHGAQRVR